MVQTYKAYRTLDGDVLDLSHMSEQEVAFLERCYEDYLKNRDWVDFANVVSGLENPLLVPTNGWITREIQAHPLFQALRDLEDRLGIRQDMVGPEPGDDLDSDPFESAA